jgi:hypothetical protein
MSPAAPAAAIGRARGVAEKDLEWLKSKFISPKDKAQMVVDGDRTVTY